MDTVVAVRAGDRSVADLLAAVTDVAGTRPTVVHTSAEAELALRSRGYDLLVLDPDVVGLHALLPATGPETPPTVGWLGVVSSARVAELLDAGAEDVLDPSMASVELAARLRRAASHRGTHLTAQPAVLGGLRVDARLREVSWQGQPIALTPREIEVLQVLVAAAGRPVTRETVYRQVWRWTMPRGDRTVDVNVKRLRDKLAAAGLPVEVVTQPGVGYRVSLRDGAPVVTGL